MDVLVVTDSRGRGLSQLIRQERRFDFWNIKVAYLPSSSLEKLAVEAIQEEARIHYDRIIIFGGICSLTEKVTIGRERRLHYTLDNNRELKVRGVIDTITDIYSRFPGKVSVCTIPPASLIKYYTVYNPGKELPIRLEEEQDQLIEDIEYINNVIRDQNKSAEQKTINTASRVYKHSIKRYRNQNRTRRVSRFTDKDLPDGVHCTEKVKKEIHGIIIADILKYGGAY